MLNNLTFIANNIGSSVNDAVEYGRMWNPATNPAAIAKDNAGLMQLKRMYGEMRAHDVLLQCMYMVKIENIFDLNGDIPWFNDKTLTYLVTDTELSFGSGESESFYAGALPAGYMTQKTEDDIDMTFIETLNGDIFKSYRACHKMIFNADGTVNEPKKYAFKLTIGLIHNKKNNHIAPVARSWIVCVKSGRTEVSSAGRSEVIKDTITFQKLRPPMFER